MGAMTIRRVVPNLVCRRVHETRSFYEDVFGFEVVMDLGWIVTLASPENETAQISLTEGSPHQQEDNPVLTIEVADVDDINRRALNGQQEITMALRDEEWGVRRFFIRDPDGRIVNVMSHPALHSNLDRRESPA
jgi:catechol 2,3-dioxygenase-like lactoylglutathione lyase family enzyme